MKFEVLMSKIHSENRSVAKNSFSSNKNYLDKLVKLSNKVISEILVKLFVPY